MNKALEEFDDLMSVYFDNETVKRKYGITEETAREKRKAVEAALSAWDAVRDNLKIRYDGDCDLWEIYHEDGFTITSLAIGKGKATYDLLRGALR